MIVEARQFPWRGLRENVTAANEGTALSTFEFDNPTYLANKFDVSRANQTDYNTAIIAFWGKTTNNYDALYRLFGRRKGGGFIESMAEGIVTLGALPITKDPIGKAVETGLWADTITNTLDAWVEADTLVVPTDKIAYLVLPVAGIADLYIEIDIDGGSGTATTEINAIITGK